MTVFLFLTITVNLAYADDKNPDILELYFFGSSTCGECQDIKHTLLYPIGQEFAGKLRINYYDPDNSKDYELMIRMEKQYKVANPARQELFLPDTFLLGYKSIMIHGRELILQRIRGFNVKR
jgi:thiol-disulfide isomerase/thioredoxin